MDKKKESFPEKTIQDFQHLLQKWLEDYATKKTEVSSKEWLEQHLCLELEKPRKAKSYAKTIVHILEIYQKNLASLQEAIQNGILKEQWLSEKIQSSSIGMAIDEYGQMLQAIQDKLYQKNKEVAEALQHSSDGTILLNLKQEDKKEEKEQGLCGEEVRTSYSYYQTKDLISSIEKNVEVMNLQTIAITTGMTFAYQNVPSKGILFQEHENVMMKLVFAGILQIAAQKAWFSFLPQKVPFPILACISCLGIENASILQQIATKKLPLMQGIDQMGYRMLSLIAVAWDITKKDNVETLFFDWNPMMGIPLAMMNGFLEGVILFWNPRKQNDTIYRTGIEVAKITKSMAKSGIKGIKPVEQP